MLVLLFVTFFVCSFLWDMVKRLSAYLQSKTRTTNVSGSKGNDKPKKKDSLLEFDIFCDIIDNEGDDSND